MKDKLKINNFNNIQLLNFSKYNLEIDSTDNNVEVVIYYIDSESDIEKFVKYTQELNLPSDNRTILVYEKGRNDGIGRDLIIKPFKSENMFGYETTKIYKLKAPNLCSLNDKLSAFCLIRTNI